MDIEKLEKLNELKEKGVLTQEEFEKQKSELLSNDKSKNKNEQDLSLWGYFVECISNKYFCFEGRARRKEYFGFLLGYIAIDTILSFLILVLTQDVELVFTVRGILNLALLLPSLSVLIRRLHDVNMSGWWILTLIVPAVMIFFKSNMEKNKYGEVPAGMIK